MKDAVVVGPILAVVVILTNAVVESSWRPNPHVVEYLLFLAFLLGLLFLWNRGKQRSVERMKALELGRRPAEPAPAPSSAPAWTPGRAIVAVGLGAPVGLFTIAWLASLTTRAEAGVVWGSAAILGMTGMLCGTMILTRLPASAFTGPDPAPPRGANGFHPGKPAMTDPDAFDVVGRRG